MKKIKYFLCGLGLLLISVQSFALNLNEALSLSESHSSELKQMRLEVESADWGRTKAFSEYLPKIDLAGRHTFDEKFQEIEMDFNGSHIVMPAISPYSAVGVTASWEIFSGFKSIYGLEAARSEYQSKVFELKRAELKNQALIRTLFYKALGSQVLVDVARQNVETLEGHRKDIQSRVRGGISTRFDTLRVDVQLEEAKSEKILAENNLVLRRAQLFQAIGQADDGKSLTGHLPDKFEVQDLSKMTLQNLSRDDMQAQVFEVEKNQNLARVARAHWYPNISLYGTEEWYNNLDHETSSHEKFKSSYALGVMFKWNIFDGGASWASQRQAAIAEKISQEKLAQLDQNVPVNLEESKRRLTYDIMNYQAKISSVRKAEEAVRLAKGALRAGTLTNTEVLDAVLDLNRAKATAVKSQIDAVEALGELELAMGRRFE